jgi:hypothetical protein
LILLGNTLYGTASNGGDGAGTLFAINTDGTGFNPFYTFAISGGGSNPYGSLILSGNTVYGTTRDGGFYGVGNVFAVNTNGLGYMN